MNLLLFLSAMRARFGVFSLMLFCTVAATTAVSFLIAKTYTATVSVLVDATDEQSMGNSMRPVVLSTEKVGYLETQTEIIGSERVARMVVQDLQLGRSPRREKVIGDATDEDGPIEEKLISGLLKKLKIETSQSSVIRVSFSSGDPRFSAEVANAFAQSYIDTMLELRVEPTRQVASWFDDQLKTLRVRLEDAEEKLADYYQRWGIISADERVDIESTSLAILSEQVVRAQEQAVQWGSRARQARESLSAGGSPDKLPEILDNAFVQRLKESLLQGEAQLRQLETQYGTNFPEYQRQVSENQSLRERLDAEMGKLVAGIELSARQSRQREAGSRQAMAAKKARVLDIKQGRNEFAVLNRNVEAAARSYDTAMQRLAISQADSGANQTNVIVLNPAVAPSKPVRPKIILNIALSIVVGTMLGIGAAMLLELFDRRVRSRSDLNLGVPLLAVINAWNADKATLLRRPYGNRRALPGAG